MGAPKGHPNYNTSKDPVKNGGVFGYLGRGEDVYTDEELRDLGEGLIEWIQQKGNIFCKYYFCTKGILWPMVHKLGARSPMFKSYLDAAKEIQESKLVSDPYHKKADGNHARFILARHHKGEWEETINVVKEDDENNLGKSMKLVTYLQSKSDLNKAESNINNAE